jgi:hypothetical protein
MADETDDRAADPGGSGAGEAAVHLADEDEGEMAGGPEG